MGRSNNRNVRYWHKADIHEPTNITLLGKADIMMTVYGHVRL